MAQPAMLGQAAGPQGGPDHLEAEFVPVHTLPTARPGEGPHLLPGFLGEPLAFVDRAVLVVAPSKPCAAPSAIGSRNQWRAAVAALWLLRTAEVNGRARQGGATAPLPCGIG